MYRTALCDAGSVYKISPCLGSAAAEATVYVSSHFGGGGGSLLFDTGGSCGAKTPKIDRSKFSACTVKTLYKKKVFRHWGTLSFLVSISPCTQGDS